MSDSKENLVYLSFDADSAGRLIGRAVLNDDPEEMSRVSDCIEAGNKLFNRWVKDRNGKQYSSGGDQGVYSINEEFVKELEELRKDYEFLTGLTVSIGIGKHLSESGQALLMAKLKGKNQIVIFDKKTKKEISEIKKRVKKGKFKSMEEYKIGQDYLGKSEVPDPECEYCQQSDGVDPDHCKWCHDEEPQDGEENCPYCKDMQNDPPEGDKMPEVGEEDCAYCNEMDQSGKDACPYCKENDTNSNEGPNQATESSVMAPRIGTGPDSTNEQAAAGTSAEDALYDQMGMSAPEIGKPLPPDQRPPIGQNAPMDVIPKDPEMEGSRFVDGDHGASLSPSIDPEDNHSKEALNLIAEQIEKEGMLTTQEVNAIDDAQLPVGGGAEGNISRPDAFNQNTPQDMGGEGPNPPSEPDENREEDPDFYGVLETGLDEHADGIQREKAIQTVSQALMQFKAAKHTLENIRMQAPDLYSASILMLKAMIEMASLLGLGASASNAPPAELGSEQAALLPPEAQSGEKPPEKQNDEWHDPFPTHPDQGGEAKPGHAPSKNNPSSGGTIGQPIGKLSSKHTTEHVARIPTPPGAINSKGQQKIIDPATGKTRWIDRKQGMVQSATGVPIKSPSRGPANGPKN
jgi:hypothetical protein